jgi:very-short-patch-repair endonuclease
MTEREKRLWWHLRQRLPTSGTHFRRQVPIDSLVVDFCCLKSRLNIEADGHQHGFDDHEQRAAARTRTFEAKDYRVLRFSDRYVVTSIDVVLDTILAGTRTSPPTPDPSPQGGGERAP